MEKNIKSIFNEREKVNLIFEIINSSYCNSDLPFNSKDKSSSDNNRFKFLASTEEGRVELKVLISEGLHKRQRLRELLKYLQAREMHELNLYHETIEKIDDLNTLLKELEAADERS